MRRVWRFAAVACCVLSGCGSLDAGRYAPAPGKPVAKLRVQYADTTGARAQIRVIDQAAASRCAMGISDIKILTTLGGVPSSGYTPAWEQDVVLAAGEEIVMDVFSDRYGVAKVETCGFRVGFQPQAEAEYVLIYSSLPGRCRLELTRRVPGPDGVARLFPVEMVDRKPACK